MSQNYCKECGKAVVSNASGCPHCGARLKDRSKLGCLSGIGLILILWWLGYYYGKPNIDNNAQLKDISNPAVIWQDQDNSFIAYTMLQDHVKQHLKSPDAVMFHEILEIHSDHVKRIGNQKYLISSYVDYKNAAGSKIRTRFIGEIQQIREDEWDLISLDFL